MRELIDTERDYVNDIECVIKVTMLVLGWKAIEVLIGNESKTMLVFKSLDDWATQYLFPV